MYRTPAASRWHDKVRVRPLMSRIAEDRRLAQFLLPSKSNGGLAQIVVGHDASTNYAQGALTYTYNSTTPSLSYVSLGNNTTNSAMLNVLGNGNVGIGSTNPVVALDIGQKTDGLLLPRGATSQRPASPVNGTLRYNSDSSAVEVYQNSVWNNVSAGGAATAGGSAGRCSSTASTTSWPAAAACSGITPI